MAYDTLSARTERSIASSRDELERVLRKHGALSFGYEWEPHATRISFNLRRPDGKVVSYRMKYEMPDRAKHEVTPKKAKPRDEQTIQELWEADIRQGFRSFVAYLRLKLEYIDRGVTDIDTELLPYLVIPSGHTIGHWCQHGTNPLQPMTLGR